MVFDVPRPSVPIAGTADRFPVRRIFCIGKNYADHVREMGGDPQKTPPVFFTKPADAVFVPEERGALRFPAATGDLHFEAELVVALGEGGEDLSLDRAERCVFGTACGCDLTRRDLQAEAKSRGEPWDTAKALDDGAVVGPITRGPVPADGGIRLSVNGSRRQDGRFTDMIWPVPQIIAKLSSLFALRPGDLIFTGTPEGVGALAPKDSVLIEATGCAPLAFEVVPR